jgi:hypothetical protein
MIAALGIIEVNRNRDNGGYGGSPKVFFGGGLLHLRSTCLAEIS